MAGLTLTGAIIIQVLLLCLSLVAVIARFYVRLHLSSSRRSISDLFLVSAWFSCLLWVIFTTLALELGFDNLVNDDKSAHLNQTTKKLLFAANFPFDNGLFLVKSTLIAFYYEKNLFPRCHWKEWAALNAVTAYTAAAWFATLFSDIFTCHTVSDNWSTNQDSCTTWFSLQSFIINYTLNVSSDLLVYGLPFMLLRRVKMDQKVKIGLIGTFMLGGCTITICTLRFVWGNLVDVFPPTVTLLCTSEYTTALLVVCAPSMKPLLFRGKGDPFHSSGEVNLARMEEALRRYDDWSKHSDGREEAETVERSSSGKGGDSQRAIMLGSIDTRSISINMDDDDIGRAI